MASARDRPASVLLADGRGMVAGGRLSDGRLTTTTEIFNPAGSTRSAGPAMVVARWIDFLVRLPDGRPQAIGGGSRTLLRDGRVLVIPGGSGPAMIFSAGTESSATSGAKPDTRQKESCSILLASSPSSSSP